MLLLLSITGCGDEATASITSSKYKIPGSSNTNIVKEKSPPHMVNTVYETLDNVIADYDATEFGADPTGQSDSSIAINLALKNCSDAGGGTVFLPCGTYLLTSNITIPSYVTLRGDWQDPDVGTNYGTIIIADGPVGDILNDGLISLEASSGVNGLTVYYKNQDIDNVTPYPFTFYMKPGMLASIKNCTIINGYRGIGTGREGHEQLIIKNVKGTVLRTGAAINNSSDVGTIDGLVFTSKYWSEAGSGLKAADKSKIEAYTKANAEGLYITDAEQQQMYNITLSGFKNGILFPSVETRYMGSGSFYNLNITNCDYGIYAEEGTHNNGRDTMIDFRWGYNIANSVIEGDTYSICNNSVERQKYTGCFKLSDVKIKGDGKGHVLINSYQTADLSKYEFNTLRSTKTTGTYFKLLNNLSTEEDIQKALDEAGNSGGGIVYLAAGYYKISKGLTVPKNVLLRGKSGSPIRIAMQSTVFVVEQNGYDSATKAEKAKSLITLDGDNAGISGIFFHYKENADIVKNNLKIKYFPYAVSGNGKGVYATNLCIVAASHGIDFSNCEDFVIEGIQTTCFNNCVKVGGKNGIVMNCLQNVTVLVRSGYNFLQEEEKVNIFDLTRYNTDFARVENGENTILLNCFGYGLKTLVKSTNSNNLLCVNIGADNIGDTTYMHEFKGGTATVINSLRYNGHSFKNDGCNLQIYNRMAIWHPNEEDIK